MTSRQPTVAVLSAPGTNRHRDMQLAFELAGARVVHVDVTELPERSRAVADAQIVAVAGGFAFADALGSGRVFAEELMSRAGDLVRDRVSAGVPILGVCNGFQTLVRTGLLPGEDVGRATLAVNSHGSFECRWVELAASPSRCIWTSGVSTVLSMPVAHGEGRLLVDASTRRRLGDDGLVALRYCDNRGTAAGGRYPLNPNGSTDDIAGLCDTSVLVLGMMPHPENHVTFRQGRAGSVIGPGSCALAIFQNGVSYVR